MENYYVEYPKPLRVNINKYKRFWTNQSLRGDLMDKGGSFNVNLYLDYLDAINYQPIRYVEKK
jgi:hypothetical protein